MDQNLVVATSGLQVRLGNVLFGLVLSYLENSMPKKNQSLVPKEEENSMKFYEWKLMLICFDTLDPRP